MANFCYAFGMGPAEYKALTLVEFAAFLKVLEVGKDE